MEIDYRGANSVVIKSKSGIVVSDPIGNIKEIMNPETITIATQDDFIPKEANFIIDMPGEYEKNNISIVGIPMQRYGDSENKNSIMFRVVVDGIRIALIGHINSPIEDDDLESLGIIDIVVIPINGGEHTLNARDAASIVRQLDPKIIIPTSHPKNEINDELDGFLKELTSFANENVDKIKIKNAQLPQVATIYSLKKK